MYKKNWTSILVTLYLEGDNPSIIQNRRQAYNDILNKLWKLPTFQDQTFRIKDHPSKEKPGLHLLGTVDRIMKIDELKDIVLSSTQYPEHLIRTIQL